MAVDAIATTTQARQVGVLTKCACRRSAMSRVLRRVYIIF